MLAALSCNLGLTTAVLHQLIGTLLENWDRYSFSSNFLMSNFHLRGLYELISDIFGEKVDFRSLSYEVDVEKHVSTHR